MKYPKSFLLGLTGVMTIAATPALSQSNSVNKVLFSCDKNNNGVLATVASNPTNNKQESIITWIPELIDSNDIEKDCQNASEKFAQRLSSGDPSKAEIYLAVETTVSDKSSSQNKIATYIVCLANESGGTCNPDGSDRLVRIKTEFQQGETHNSITKIINPKFASIDGSKVRTVGVTYSKIRSRTFWQMLGF